MKQHLGRIECKMELAATKQRETSCGALDSKLDRILFSLEHSNDRLQVPAKSPVATKTSTESSDYTVPMCNTARLNPSTNMHQDIFSCTSESCCSITSHSPFSEKEYADAESERMTDTDQRKNWCSEVSESEDIEHRHKDDTGAVGEKAFTCIRSGCDDGDISLQKLQRKRPRRRALFSPIVRKSRRLHSCAHVLENKENSVFHSLPESNCHSSSFQQAPSSPTGESSPVNALSDSFYSESAFAEDSSLATKQPPARCVCHSCSLCLRMFQCVCS